MLEKQESLNHIHTQVLWAKKQMFIIVIILNNSTLFYC
jgi:hypothetical protein